MKRLAFILLVGLFTNSCSWFGNVEEGDRNTNTWKGQLVKDCNGEPAAHVDLRLEVAYDEFGADEYEVIAEGTTDANGHFSLTYKKIIKGNARSILMYEENGQFSDGLLLSGPVNKSVYRNVSLVNCNLVYLDCKNALGEDSIFLTIGKLVNAEYKKVFKFQGHGYHYVAIDLNGQSFSHLFMAESIFQPTWNNEPQKYRYGMAFSELEIKRAIMSYQVDSIENGYNTYEFSYSGYPTIDTIQLQ